MAEPGADLQQIRAGTTPQALVEQVEPRAPRHPSGRRAALQADIGEPSGLQTSRARGVGAKGYLVVLGGIVFGVRGRSKEKTPPSPMTAVAPPSKELVLAKDPVAAS